MVSIITPCYNSSKTIAQTIESVINQTYKDWEMIIVNDCSTDNTAEIVENYIKQDSRIRLLSTSKASGSPSLPRNIALDNAIGEWIAFLDSDDLWLPNKLEEQLSFASTYGYRFVYSNYEKINSQGERNNRTIQLAKKSTYRSILGTNTIPCLTVLVRSELVSNSRMKDIPKEDYAFWLELLKKEASAYNTCAIHALYREQRNSRSSNKFKMITAQWYVLREVENVAVLPCCYYMIVFVINAVMKYLK